MARTQPMLGLLAGIPLFSACTERQLRTIGSLAAPRHVPAGAVVTEEGQRGDEFYVVASGRARVSLNGRKLAELGPGDFFGEMALLDQGPRAATVTALDPMDMHVFAAPAFRKLLDGAPDVGKRILRGLAARLREVDGRRISPTA